MITIHRNLIAYIGMLTLKEIDAQLAALHAQRDEVRKNELKDAVAQIRSLVSDYGLSAQDVFPIARRTRKGKTHGKAPIKYRDPASGATWTGRGKPPKWIAGQDRERFCPSLDLI